jgi:molybdenum cofactor cytidylyltransferase
MKFEELPLEAALGHVLGHNVFARGKTLLPKGTRLGSPELTRLREAALDSVYVARIEPGDVLENVAADRIATALSLPPHNIGYRGAATGRVTLRSQKHGVLRVDAALLLELNRVEGVTLASLRSDEVVSAERPIATLKIIPFALSEEAVSRAEEIAGRGVLRVVELRPKRVRILAFGGPGREAEVLTPYFTSLSERLKALGSTDVTGEFVPLLGGDSEARLAEVMASHFREGVDLLIVVGETATMDENDLAPSALRRAGGVVTAVGAPVFPGNLLLVGRHGTSAIMGAPGCARHQALNVVDLVLPRLLIGEKIQRDDVAALGLGGFIQPERP